MDSDAADYIERIEDDLQMLVAGAVKMAVNRFVIGCKADHAPLPGVKNWDALAAGCCSLMAGWPSYLGCFHQLTGPATSTNSGFTAGDYAVDSGLKGDGLPKYLTTGMMAGDFERLDCSLSAYTTEPEGTGAEVIAGYAPATANRFSLRSLSSTVKTFYPSTTVSVTVPSTKTGLIGGSRSNATSVSGVYGGTLYTATNTANNSDFASNAPLRVFANHSASPGVMCTARIAFYHFGKAVDLVALERRVKQYMRDISAGSASIPRLIAPSLSHGVIG